MAPVNGVLPTPDGGAVVHGPTRVPTPYNLVDTVALNHLNDHATVAFQKPNMDGSLIDKKYRLFHARYCLVQADCGANDGCNGDRPVPRLARGTRPG